MKMRDFIRIVESDNAFRSLTDTAEFMAWFSGSKIVGVDGQPLVVWHGLKEPLIHIDDTNKRALFSPSFLKFDVSKSVEPGAWFSPDPEVARKYGSPAPFFLRALNPLREESPISEPPSGHDAVYRTRSSRNDVWDAWEIAVFGPDQIRLAFDADRPDIRLV